MLELFFSIIESIDSLGWIYVVLPLFLGLGIYLSCMARWFQIRQLPIVFSNFKKFVLQKSDDSARGIKPIYAFFAYVGVGNVVGVCTAVQIGGPGAVFWMWVTAIIGMLIKYSEIYLGIKFRIKDKQDSYFGGPMIYLRRVPGGRILAPLVAVFLCLYGVEIYIFQVVTDSISSGWGLNSYFVMTILLILILGIGRGGVRVVGRIGSYLIPFFVAAYSFMSFFVLAMNFTKIPGVFLSIFTHAFQPHSAIGAFAGSTVVLAMTNGMKRACYTGDIGIGYSSTIHSESREANPCKQASLGIMDIFLDTFIICNLSVFVILLTGTWNQGVSANWVVAESFSKYFTYVHIIWPLYIFLLGYSTLLAYFAVGRKSAMFLFPKYGSVGYMIFTSFVLIISSFTGTMVQCLSVMAIIGLLLLLINIYGLFWLRDEINFDLRSK